MRRRDCSACSDLESQWWRWRPRCDPCSSRSGRRRSFDFNIRPSRKGFEIEVASQSVRKVKIVSFEVEILVNLELELRVAHVVHVVVVGVAHFRSRSEMNGSLLARLSTWVHFNSINTKNSQIEAALSELIFLFLRDQN